MMSQAPRKRFSLSPHGGMALLLGILLLVAGCGEDEPENTQTPGAGADPETVEVDSIPARVEAIRTEGRLNLGGRHPVVFTPRADLVFHKRRSLPEHPNGMRFTAMDEAGEVLRERVFYSVGGGFVVDDALADEDRIVPLTHRLRLDELAAQMPDETYEQQREGTRVRIGQGKATQPSPVPAEEIR